MSDRNGVSAQGLQTACVMHAETACGMLSGVFFWYISILFSKIL